MKPQATKAATPKKSRSQTKKRTYLREVQIRFKKKRVKDGSPVGKAAMDAEQVAALFADLQNDRKEKLLTLNLDAKNRILCFEVIAMGSVDAIYGRPMETFRTAFPVNANGAIVVHNHPSGDPTPSPADIRYTKTLQRMAKDMGLLFHDHIIIGDETYYSFADEGYFEDE